jgi:uncharacterized protein
MKNILLMLFVILGVTLFFGVHSLLPYAILCPMRVHSNENPANFNLKYDSLNIHIKKSPNIVLKTYWIHANQPKGIMILVHGIGSCKEHLLGVAANLAQKGIESIVFDGRAHGESSGEFCTYGFYEKRDISRIVEVIQSKNPNLRIGIWGNSLGGAVAIQALASDKRLDFGVIESTFTDLSQIVSDYQTKILHGVRLRWVSDYALWRAGHIANFNPDEVKPIEAVKNITQPVFLAHGDADTNIRFEYGEQLFENLGSKEKEFFAVKGGGHFDLSEKGGVLYETHLMNFVVGKFISR